MNRNEFSNELRKALSGYFSPEEIQDTVEYYEDYIDRQMQKGKSEAEVLEAIGDPRLLAKSMIAAGKRTEEKKEAHFEAQESVHVRRFRIPSWVALVGIFLIIIIIAVVLFSVVMAVILWILPIALVVSACYLGYQYFIKKRK